jgi:mono/diheme cytochrome c family protein
MGADLYQAGCAICHDAQNRAPMVPPLHPLEHLGAADYWQQWISNSKPSSLMPAFAKAYGGPLSEAQIGSLVSYLSQPTPSPLSSRN